MSLGRATSNDSIASSVPTLGPTRAKILCINPDAKIAAAIDERMSDLPVDILRARNGMQGYWLAISKNPSLIVTDLRMTNGHGGEIIESLKQNSQTRDIPIIVMTNHDYPGLQRHAERMGATHCFKKPLDMNDLFNAVTEVFAASA